MNIQNTQHNALVSALQLSKKATVQASKASESRYVLDSKHNILQCSAGFNARGFSAAPSNSDSRLVKISSDNTSPENAHSQQASLIDKTHEQQASHNALSISFAEQREAAREAAEIKAENARKMQLAFEIAGRIMRGDNVPQSDKNFLGEQSPGLLMMAMSSRNLGNENPIDHRSLLRESDRQSRRIHVVPTKQAAMLYQQMPLVSGHNNAITI